ncbi:Mor transcription activator family protein [Parathalassolituus penaei]|uniref:Mor transcription activator domain-containing protein n=1 Tax=Parathalassolituus penaei TaxID=2997323 RepID=A0A9X3EEK1_9GAMM|nr:Mor transcription activator family protein [Parathalassolituus penaei]MCY0966152.1 hypothetical protein [Parathalassolituus penaei]
MDSNRKLNAPEFLADLFQIVAQVARQQGCDPEQADAIADACTDSVAKEWGGLSVYIGKGTHMNISRRDMAIYQEFTTGNTAQALARKHGVTRVWIYAIIRRVKQQLETEAGRKQQSLL